MNALAITALCVLSGCPVALTQHLGVTGLWTEPSALTDAPDGAMDIATDVVFRRAGTVEPRPGFATGTETGGSIDEIKALIPFDGQMLAVGLDGATSETRWVGGGAVLTDLAAELSWDGNHTNVRGVEARKNLYLTTADAVRKLTSASDDVASLAGAPFIAGYEIYKSGSTYSDLANDTRTAFRLVVRRTDANGVVTRSSPSSRYTVEATGGAGDSNISVYFPPDDSIIAGDVIEVYRSLSVANTLTPSDTMYLAIEQVVSAAHVSAAFVAILGKTLSARLGAALYTNSTREGIERQNIKPPLATDLALYNGSVFASNLTYPPRLQTIIPQTGVRTASATGIGSRVYTGARTNGSADVTGMSSIVGLKVGMAVQWNTVLGQEHIIAVSGTTVTMSTAWTGATDGAPASLTFYDTVKIWDGANTYYFVSDTGSLSRDMTAGLTSAGNNFPESPLVSGRLLGEGNNTLNAGTATYIARQAFLFEGFRPSTAIFYVSATHGDEFEPPLVAIDTGNGSTGTVATQDVFTNGIAWSKADQPEHFTLGGGALIGNALSPILRIFSTLDGLWILKGKGDGLYRLSGYGERSGWSTRQVDSSLYLLHPKLACQMGDKVYGWTNRGAVEISDAGINELSSATIATDVEEFERLINAASEELVYCIANEKSGEVIWQIGAVEQVDYKTYVFNTRTRAWSRWFADSSHTTCAAYQSSTGLISLGRDDSGTTRIERSTGATVQIADRDFAIVVATATTTAITINAGSGWTPAVGDMVVQGVGIYAVTAFTSATAFTVHASGLTAAAATAYESYQSVMRWRPKSSPGPSVAKRFSAIIGHWDSSAGMYAYSVTAESTQNPGTEVELSYTLTRIDSDTENMRETRALLPRSVALAPRMRPGIKVRNVDSRWRLSGLTLEYEPLGTRVVR